MSSLPYNIKEEMNQNYRDVDAVKRPSAGLDSLPPLDEVQRFAPRLDPVLQ